MQDQGKERAWGGESRGHGFDRGRSGDHHTRFLDGRDMDNSGSARGEWLQAEQPEHDRYRGNVRRFRPREGEPEDANWTQRQGLYGSSEYGGWLGGQYRQGTAPDEPRAGSRSRVQGHAGKGPKGWQRSDERIRDDVCEALARDAGVDASDIEVQVEGGEVTLVGSVCDRPEKRRAEDIADAVFGVQEVQNRIRVKRERDEGTEASSGRIRDRDHSARPA